MSEFQAQVLVLFLVVLSIIIGAICTGLIFEKRASKAKKQVDKDFDYWVKSASLTRFMVTDGTHKKQENEVYFNTIHEVYDYIKAYLEKRGLKSYYFRQTQHDLNTMWIDYGSYTHFFYVTTIPINVSK